MSSIGPINSRPTADVLTIALILFAFFRKCLFTLAPLFIMVWAWRKRKREEKW